LKQLIQNHILHLTTNNEFLLIASNQIDKLTEQHREKYIAKRDMYEKLLRETLEKGIQTGDFPPIDVRLTALAILSATGC
jgi:hypothetical protein